MLQEFRVKNFLSFKEEQILSFEPTSDTHYKDEYCIEVSDNVKLLKTAFIYGANGSGKTNLLASINFLKDLITIAPNDNNEPIGVDQFLLDDISKTFNSFFSTIFYIDKKKYIYEIELNDKVIIKENLIYYPSIRRTKLYSRSYDPQSNLSLIEFGNHAELSRKDTIIMEGNTLNNSTVLATLSKVNIADSILNRVQNYFRSVIQNVLEPKHSLESFSIQEMESKPESKEFILRLLKKTGFNIDNIDIKNDEIEVTPEMKTFIESAPFSDEKKKSILDKGKIENKELIFLHKTSSGSYSLKSGVQSNGTMRYLGMISLLYSLVHNKAVMCIDEIESSLHYALLRQFIKLFLELGKNQSQLIFTTHDINILDEDFIRKDTIWFTEKNIDGETIVERLSTKGLHKNISVYNAYKQGKIGGIPNINN